MRSLATVLILAVFACAHDHEEDPSKVPTRPVAPPDEVSGAVAIISYKGAPRALKGVERSREEALARAKEALEHARARGASFADVVAEFSDDPGNRGRLGLIVRGRSGFPVIEEALFNMEVGQVSDILESDFGFLIVTRVKTRTPAGHILIAYQGAKDAPETVTRSREEARALAEEVHRRVTEGREEFAKVASERSDCRSRADGGGLGVIVRGQMPPTFEDVAFSLDPGQVSHVVETEAGFHVIICAILHWHASHILIAYRGADGAPATVTRSKEEAMALAEDLSRRLRAGEDFATLAAEFSDCPSKAKGGHLGGFNRGEKHPAFEAAVAALDLGAISGVVETPAGFHLIRRTE